MQLITATSPSARRRLTIARARARWPSVWTCGSRISSQPRERAAPSKRPQTYCRPIVSRPSAMRCALDGIGAPYTTASVDLPASRCPVKRRTRNSELSSA